MDFGARWRRERFDGRGEVREGRGEEGSVRVGEGRVRMGEVREERDLDSSNTTTAIAGEIDSAPKLAPTLTHQPASRRSSKAKLAYRHEILPCTRKSCISHSAQIISMKPTVQYHHSAGSESPRETPA